MEKEALYLLKNIETIYNIKDNFFLHSLIHTCIIFEIEEVALEVLKRCVNVELADSLLMYAISHSKEELVLELVKITNIDPNTKDEDGKTILKQALESNMKKVVKEILTKYNYNHIYKDGNTALILACKKIYNKYI